ncbi:MAG: hypothetical protein AB7J30_20060, partial [Hyphomicrobium sp.]|uniref:hypothetical protein n=1 Tax=Hyphomicrobium sp. TaxID=82 RepID=UPI003D1144A5
MLTRRVSSPEPTARRSFSVDEFCARHGISRSLFYDEVRDGRLRIVKAGRRSLVTVEAEAEWLKRPETGGQER